MRLVTFQWADGRSAAGALVDGDTRVVDLQAAYMDRWRDPSPMLSSVLAMAETGEASLSLASEVIAGATRAGTNLIGRDGVRLCAPIPRPPQMRDFLCFEKHLIQAFRQGRIVRSQRIRNRRWPTWNSKESCPSRGPGTKGRSSIIPTG